MNQQEFEMNMLIGGWERNDTDNHHCDEIFTHPESKISLGVSEKSEQVIVFMDEAYVGPTTYLDAIDKINFHMMLLADLK